MAAYVVLLFAGLGLAQGSADVFFTETFDEDVFATSRWLKSAAEKYRQQALLVKNASVSEDPGVQVVEENRHVCFGHRFPEPLDPAGRDLVLQYELKLEDTLSCGGAYIKMPRASPDFDVASMTDASPYSIMFGPDRCGATNKVHFILQHQSPVSLRWEEKHFADTVPVTVDKKTHLYTLLVRASGDFTIFVDRKEVGGGNLLTKLTPPINPPAEIDDPDDRKPSDWVEEEKIPDPSAHKPEDWDEDQPAMVPDAAATRPEGWDEDAPALIPDPEAKKPEDWDDGEDGEWEAPMVPNPVCQLAGCGQWSPPMVRNPKYKGKWRAPLVDNPAYKGPWKPRKISNPDYFFQERPAVAPMAGIAVEIWTTNAGLHFDSFFVGFSLEAAFKFADQTFAPKQAAEAAAERAEEARRMGELAKKKKAEGGMLNWLQGSYMELREHVLGLPRRTLFAVLGLPVVAVLSLLWLVATSPSKRVARPHVSDQASDRAAGGSAEGDKPEGKSAEATRSNGDAGSDREPNSNKLE